MVKKEKETRDVNIELLRSVLMVMIILFHLIVHGCRVKGLHLSSYHATNHDFFYLFALSFLCVAVNCFIFISGYYGIKFKIKTLVSFWAQGVFYALGIYLCSVFAFNFPSFNIKDLLFTFMPFASNLWWFFNIYIGLFVLSPIINKGVEAMNKRSLLSIIVILTYLGGSFVFSKYSYLASDGLSIFTMSLVYIIARFLKINNISISKSALLYIVSSLFLFSLVFVLYKLNFQGVSWRLTTYNSVFVLVGAVFLFYMFKNLKIKSYSIIYQLAPLVFGVYLLHDHPFSGRLLSQYVWDVVGSGSLSTIYICFFLFKTTLIVFVVGCIVEKIRQIITNPFINYIAPKIEKLYDKFILSFYNILDKHNGVTK